MTGRGVARYIEDMHEQLAERRRHESALHEEIKRLEKEVSKLSVEQGASQIDSILAGAEEWNGSHIAVSYNFV